MSKVCCFIGHRKIKETDELSDGLYSVVKNLIEKENVATFLFGSRSQFDDWCLETVTNLKTIYPYIKRIYKRAEFPYISDDYKSYLLNYYDDTFFPEAIIKAGRAVYIERNKIMIDKSDIVIMYYDENYLPKARRYNKNIITFHHTASGTKLSYDYAKKKNKMIINIAHRNL